MRKFPGFTTAALLAAFLIGGCAVSNPDSPYYTNTSQQQKTARVYYGQVMSVSGVNSKNKEQDPWADAAGVVLEGLNKGGGQNTGQVIGAVLGGLAGQALGQPAQPKEVEILVLMEGSNEVVKVVQNNDVAFKTGQRVRVVVGGGINRVLPLQ
ncbi:outer membrane lipoprotein [Paralysiella testudinis]|uniref:Glycine zipper 2TM domain-containing protein n=1 Tax=Paralysiella testudinis TaxID=2809020 RepID=A0A892ZK85_9NEIS|nr:hypothetical protein [Paralysiella testudinis]QRQ82217.1 hypothetical protein JQU52_02005 [Paralysiella testudinis]